MTFREYWRILDAREKRELCEKLETTRTTLSRVANNHNLAGSNILLNIAKASGGRVTAESFYGPEGFQKREA